MQVIIKDICNIKNKDKSQITKTIIMPLIALLVIKAKIILIRAV